MALVSPVVEHLPAQHQPLVNSERNGLSRSRLPHRGILRLEPLHYGGGVALDLLTINVVLEVVLVATGLNECVLLQVQCVFCILPNFFLKQVAQLFLGGVRQLRVRRGLELQN